MAPEAEAAIAALAARQHGYVTRAQLLELGLGRQAVTYRVKTGRLIQVHSGVYALGHAPQAPVAHAAAAVLACGPGAALSHSSAATLWGIFDRWREPFEVTTSRDRRRPGIRTHRTHSLPRSDTRLRLGIRVTSPARTLVDLAPRLTRARLVRAYNDLRLEGHLKTPPAQLEALLDLVPDAPTRSAFEDEFLALAGRFGLPRPEVNVRVAGRELDVLFRSEKVIVELDGYRFHDGRRSFESDRERDAASLEEGFVTVRVTWVRMTADPTREAQRLQRILQERSG